MEDKTFSNEHIVTAGVYSWTPMNGETDRSEQTNEEQTIA
jgi:hypothetical protein